MNKDVMWLIFVLIIIGIVFSLQRNNVNFFPKGSQLETPPSGSNSVVPAPTPTPVVPGNAKKTAININIGAATSGDASQEYISLENFDYENKQAAVISGMKLQNRDNVSATIGKDEYGNNIALNYGERAVVATAISPIGKNFKINKCSGYLAQGKSFSPAISFSCPRISDLNLPRSLNNRCIDYIESLNSCAVPTINADTGINNDCAEFVSQHASYTGCLADHKNDSDFIQPEWRIYLGKNAEMWGQKHENIQLFDQSGNLIKETSY